MSQDDHLYKERLAEDIAFESGFDKESARDYVDAFFESVTETLARGEAVAIRDFGRFSLRRVGHREGRNPQTGDAIAIPAHRQASFHPAKALAEGVNAHYHHLAPRLIEQRAWEEDESRTLGRYLLWIIGGLLVLLLLATGTYYWINSAAQKTPSQPPAPQTATKAPAPVSKPAPVEPAPAAKKPPETATASAPGNAPSALPDHHRVSRTDNLWRISERYWLDATLWPAIYGHNHLSSDPDLIYAGMLLRLPAQPKPAESPRKKAALEADFLRAYAAYLRADKESKALWLLYLGHRKYALFPNLLSHEAIDASHRAILKKLLE